MKAVIIPSSSSDTLTPLICGQSIQELSVMGKPLIHHTTSLLKMHNICEIFTLDKIPDTDDNLLLIENNLISDCNITDAISAHTNAIADITAVLRLLDADDEGTPVTISADNFITGISGAGYRSVPSKYEPEGIYILSSNAKKLIQSDLGGGLDLLNLALEKQLKIHAYINDRPSVSINSTEDYRKCHTMILNGSLPVSLSAAQVRNGLWLEDGAEVENGVKIETPVYISSGCRIERGAHIGGKTVIGENCVIRSDSFVECAIIGNNCTLSEKSAISGGILSDNVNIGTSSKILEGAIIGSGCRIEGDCTINSGVRVWPNKRILHGTRLNDNLVWGSVATEHLFKGGKICGEINIDITPEFMAKLGAALGTIYRFGKVGLGYDSVPVCSMLASAVASGLISSGTKLYMFGEQSLPVMRNATKYYALSMSLHINQAGSDGVFYPEIVFMEENGANFSSASEHKLENTFFTNVFLRADAKKLCDPYDLTGYKLSYVQNILNKIKSRDFNKNLEARTRSETVSEILELILGEIEQSVIEDSPKEFSIDIAGNGEQFILYTADGKKLDNNMLLYVLSIVLLKHMNVKAIVLPVSAPSQLEELIKNNGATVIYCGTSDREFMQTILKNGLEEQFNLFFDGVFASVILLDYLNFHGVDFSTLVKKLPTDCRLETEIECPDSKKNDIIKQLFDKYSDGKTNLTDGIKIYQESGWVLVIPEKHRHFVRIITEGYNMEAAEEISTIFTKQIKRLAKLG